MAEEGTASARRNGFRLGKFGIGVGIVALYMVFLFGVFAGFSGYLSRVNLGRELAALETESATRPDIQVKTLDENIFLFSRLQGLEAGIARLELRIIEDTPAHEALKLKSAVAADDVDRAKGQIGGYLEEASQIVNAHSELLEDQGADEASLGDTTKIVARVEPHKAPRAGETVRLAIDTEKVHFFEPASGEVMV